VNDQGDHPDLTGGYLLEIDVRHDEDYFFQTPQGLYIGTDDPDSPPDQATPEQPSYISEYVDNAENALFSPGFTDPNTGWRNYFDEASAVNFYIVNDVMGNEDGGEFYSSVYLYKDAGNPLLYMGPIWDYDGSSGNTEIAPISSPTVPWMQTQAPWYVQLFKDPTFQADVTKQFDALEKSGIFARWIDSIQKKAATLQQSQINHAGSSRHHREHANWHSYIPSTKHDNTLRDSRAFGDAGQRRQCRRSDERFSARRLQHLGRLQR
jgi:hypothetical protein